VSINVPTCEGCIAMNVAFGRMTDECKRLMACGTCQKTMWTVVMLNAINPVLPQGMFISRPLLEEGNNVLDQWKES
jgi:hypothetical protein